MNKPVRTTTPNGEEIVIISAAEYERLVELAEDAGEIAIAEKALADYRSGRVEALTQAELNEFLVAPSAVEFWRKRRGLTQATLAKAVGVSQGFIAQIETGKRTGDVKLYRRLAEALGVSVDQVLPDEAAPPITPARRAGKRVGKA